MKIQYIVHSTTLDNQSGIVSGWHDCPLSPLGIEQAHNLHLKLQSLEAGSIFVSPLLRAKQTAEILFTNVHIQEDDRLKEIHYGLFTHKAKHLIDDQRKKYITERFPEGESYLDVEERIKKFLLDNQHIPLITVISHQAPQLALEVICHGISWENALLNDWRLVKISWKPFWIYEFKCHREES
jgi:broad specificity phosphatase PhoE